jgi:NlpC/P60 family
MASFDGQDFVNYLKQFLGTPYVWGGNSLTSGVDCSGLVQQGLLKFGVDVPRVTNDQIGVGKAVDMDHLQVGDLVFFDTDPGRAGPDHVGVYAGNGMMIHAPRPGKTVEMADMTSKYYASRFMGGRRMDGMTSTGGSDGVATPQTVAKLSPEEMASNYGWAYGFMKSVPEISNLFDQAVSGSWTPDKFQAEVKNTKFYQDNSDTTRNALVLKQTDPATYNAQVDAAKAKVQQMATDAGAAITDSKLNDIADQVVMFGMDDAHINKALSGYITYVDGTLKGKAGIFEHNMRGFADQMGVSLNDDAYKSQAQMIAAGMSTQDDFQNFIRQQSVSAFPAFKDQINAGQTMRNIANPYIQMMASNLELNPNSISLKDPTIMGGLNGLDAQGNPVGKTLTQFGDMLRGDPRWRSTQQAMDSSMNIGRQVLTNMGLING